MLGSIISAGASLLGGVLGNKKQKSADEANAELQREFAQNGIRWKVEDAKAAGVSPLYALGAPTTTGFASYTSPDQSHWANAGSAIQRAVESKQTGAERLQERLLNAQIEGQEIDNAAKRSQLALTTGAMSSPSMPNPKRPDVPWDSGERIPMYQTVETPSGPRRMVSEAYGQVLENDVSEFLRYLPRDFANRANRLGSSFSRWWSKPRLSYSQPDRGR